MFANFCTVNTPTIASFKLPTEGSLDPAPHLICMSIYVCVCVCVPTHTTNLYMLTHIYSVYIFYILYILHYVLHIYCIYSSYVFFTYTEEQ